MHNYEKLKVWERAMNFTTEIYRASAHFPVDERFGITSQLRRAAVSIPLNIAEGSGSQSNKEFKRFLEISVRSGYELLTAVELARRLGFVTNPRAQELATEGKEIVAMTIGLMRSIEITKPRIGS